MTLISTQTQLAGIRVLVVDDAVDNQTLVKHILAYTGAKVELAANGAEAVAKAMTHAFDVILMDIQMPVLDGNAATRTLRRLGYKRPIIALTALVMESDRQQCLRSGADDHLPKPVNRLDLINRVARYAAQCQDEAHRQIH